MLYVLMMRMNLWAWSAAATYCIYVRGVWCFMLSSILSVHSVYNDNKMSVTDQVYKDIH